MKLEKALERLEAIKRYQGVKSMPNNMDAIQLGIEALKRHLSLADHPDYDVRKWLPGETEE